jgi:hypothetical protein
LGSSSDHGGRPAAPERLRIDFERSGGFAGTSLATTVDTSALPADEARAIEDLVRGADFFALPPRLPRRSGGADRFQYDLTIARGRARHHVSVGEADVPAPLRPLIDHLLALARTR